MDTICKPPPPTGPSIPPKKKIPVAKKKPPITRKSEEEFPGPPGWIHYQPTEEDEKRSDWPLPPIIQGEPKTPPSDDPDPSPKPKPGERPIPEPDTPPAPKPTPPAPNECDLFDNPGACPTEPCENINDHCFQYHGDRCIDCCKNCWTKEDKKPLPPYMDEDSSPSEEDRERVWQRILLEQDMAKLTASPRTPLGMELPDDFIEKKLAPLIHPSGSSGTDIPKNIRDMINAGIKFIHPFLTETKGVEELLPAGPGPRPDPDRTRGGSMAPPSGYNPHGPVSYIPALSSRGFSRSINDDPDK